ncbi:hypothetical protein COBT_002469, partial [Conglomerata obtusa]
MNSIFNLEMYVIGLNKKDVIIWCFEKQLLHNSAICLKCTKTLKLTICKRNFDGYARKCMNKICFNYKNYTLLRINSFFEIFRGETKIILQILIRYARKTSRHLLTRHYKYLDKDYDAKIINHLIEMITVPDFSQNKLGVPEHIVKINETMFNHKSKLHRGRSPKNNTQANTQAVKSFNNLSYEIKIRKGIKTNDSAYFKGNML